VADVRDGKCEVVSALAVATTGEKALVRGRELADQAFLGRNLCLAPFHHQGCHCHLAQIDALNLRQKRLLQPRLRTRYAPALRRFKSLTETKLSVVDEPNASRQKRCPAERVKEVDAAPKAG